jgi:hypothetical protein
MWKKTMDKTIAKQIGEDMKGKGGEKTKVSNICRVYNGLNSSNNN